ncbi:unnamed protein product [Leptosia nina]|uniref:Major facilitator superfamily (MFS) profile domain-containing protein n=1 Tax=Leptosia nina TaxID=320188 RepID=A0AAV1J402_9NEOP
MVITVTSICGLCGIAVNLVPNIIASGILFIIFLLGMTIVGIYLAIAVDLFPTYLRVFAVSFILTGGRLSTIISVQTLNYMLGNHCETGFYVFSSIYAASALLACFLADDRKTANNPL